MRRITLWLCGTATALVLLLSYHTSTETAVTLRSSPAALPPGVVVAAPTSAAPAPTTAAPTTAAPTPAATAPAVVVVNGSVADTRYGPVQVQITVRAGRVSSARAVGYGTDGRTGEINSQAIPVLDGEATRAGSARIDTVSGATYTSEGYRTSLQAALDAAHLP